MKVKPIQDIMKLLSVITQIQEKWNTPVTPYYDDIDNEWSLAISDNEKYFSKEFEPVFKLVHDSFNGEISIVCFSEKMISENSDYLVHILYMVEDWVSKHVEIKANPTIVDFPTPSGKTYSYSYTQKNTATSFNFKMAS